MTSGAMLMVQLQSGENRREITLKNCLLLIDGGTTNTRFTLIDDGKIIATSKRKVGASNAVEANRNQPLEDAVRLEISRLQEVHNCTITDVYASGMITSNVGIREIPHIESPVSLKKLASSVQTLKLDSISKDISFHFIPGIKFLRENNNDPDIMRGEEVEVFGSLKDSDRDKSILFLHFGSHNKMIKYEAGAIVQAITTLSGELLWAVCNETILKSSVANLNSNFILNGEFVRNGYQSAAKNGFSKALFQARVGRVMEGLTADETLSFVFGSIVYSDLQAYLRMISEPFDALVLYGHDSFISAFSTCLEEFFPEGLNKKVKTIDFEQSENLSIQGVLSIHNYRTKGV